MASPSTNRSGVLSASAAETASQMRTELAEPKRVTRVDVGAAPPLGARVTTATSGLASRYRWGGCFHRLAVARDPDYPPGEAAAFEASNYPAAGVDLAGAEAVEG